MGANPFYNNLKHNKINIYSRDVEFKHQLFIASARRRRYSCLHHCHQERVSSSLICSSVEKMKEMLDKYKTNISNKLESQLRQPPLYFAVVNADE